MAVQGAGSHPGSAGDLIYWDTQPLVREGIRERRRRRDDRDAFDADRGGRAHAAARGSVDCLLQLLLCVGLYLFGRADQLRRLKGGRYGDAYAWDTELRRYGIRVNALWPTAQTDMSQVEITNAAARAEASGQPPATLRSWDPEPLTTWRRCVVYLCSERAAHLRSQLITTLRSPETGSATPEAR